MPLRGPARRFKPRIGQGLEDTAVNSRQRGWGFRGTSVQNPHLNASISKVDLWQGGITLPCFNLMLFLALWVVQLNFATEIDLVYIMF